MLDTLYKSSLALLTDLYQLTMAYGYWKNGIQDREAVFHLFFRKNPFNGGFTVACGASAAVEYFENLKFSTDDLDYLSTLRGNDGAALFEEAFLRFLADLDFECDIDGVVEGTVVFPQEPLMRVKGPLLQCQLLETPFLNLINFPTLIATKAARMTLAAKGAPILEFGLRRAQGVDGGATASRAAYIGGCAGTSNVLAGRLFGVPVKGTHAHSWVMCFENELEAFSAYADAMPNNCVFLVDTYNTLEGVRNAVKVGKKLRERGFEPVGIRLDSGDLAWLSIEARKILDEGGFPDAVIVASNELDEHLIASLNHQGAKIGVWGVGTRLATGYDQPALGGVYKLSAVRDRGGEWTYKLKLSEHSAKVTNPGILQVRRFIRNGLAEADAIYNETSPPGEECVIVDPLDAVRKKKIPSGCEEQNLLVPFFRDGRRVCKIPSIEEARNRTFEQLKLFHEGVKRFVNPHEYPVGLENHLHEKKMELIRKAREI